ncbi:hypothetical protein HNR59_002893 [Aquamicrobium lusatiense]|uniref:Uncharacterized protein n=1 Tax=Aquamicrobium lusatiense TaxID=89772 RepID=A0A7W9VV63_9HYPH|nr:hypothetical protein [Aquamicrobium lusatiense]MBB6013504.1 hypothetical protein [Aquamicrobium lusatiense]
MMANEQHEQKYAKFLDGLSVYMEALSNPTKRPRRSGAELDAVRQWKNQPASIDPTNWSTVANDNHQSQDNAVEEDAYRGEVVREIVPDGNAISDESIIVRSMEGVEFRAVPMADSSKKKGEHPTFLHPVSGNVEFGSAVDGEGMAHRVVTRLGKLRFSDGTQTEVATVRDSNGEIVDKQLPMRVGAMLGTRERIRGDKGSRCADGPPNQVWCNWLGNPVRAQPLKSGKRRQGRSISAAESAAELAAAIENTNNMPVVKKCPTGLPWKPERISEMFLAGKKEKTGKGGAVAWTDLAMGIDSPAAWKKIRAELLDSDKEVLDAAMTAGSYSDIGAVVGASRKVGKRALKAANDNLAAAIEKFVA